MLNLPSEAAILACIDRHFDNVNPGVLLGRGDDCAIFQSTSPICASTDIFLENVHFRTSYFEPEEIGYKALAVNISDLAAMGARPVAFQLGLGLPAWIDMPWLERFFEGMSDLAKAQNILLSGGDLSFSSSLHLAITVFGQEQDSCNLLVRGGSMPGDAIFTIGKLGLARAGLNELELQGRSAIAQWPEACEAHLKPVPQTAAGLMLARAAFNARPPALIDVSDGLAQDLPRLLGSKGLGAQLRPPENLLPAEVKRYAEDRGLNPWLEMYLGGEDYALLGACAPDMLPALHAAIPGFCHIGEVTNSGRIYLWDMDMTEIAGFDHFEEA